MVRGPTANTDTLDMVVYHHGTIPWCTQNSLYNIPDPQSFFLISVTVQPNIRRSFPGKSSRAAQEESESSSEEEEEEPVVTPRGKQLRGKYLRPSNDEEEESESDNEVVVAPHSGGKQLRAGGKYLRPYVCDLLWWQTARSVG